MTLIENVTNKFSKLNVISRVAVHYVFLHVDLCFTGSFICVLIITSLYSRATCTCIATQQAAKQSPILIENCESLTVKMASDLAHGPIHTTTKMILHNMVAILQLIGHAALVSSIHLWYWTSILWSTRYLLTSITQPYCGLKFWAL